MNGGDKMNKYDTCPKCEEKGLHTLSQAGGQYHIHCDKCGYDDWIEPLDALQEIALLCAGEAREFIENMKGDEDILQALYSKFYDIIFDNIHTLEDFFYGEGD